MSSPLWRATSTLWRKMKIDETSRLEKTPVAKTVETPSTLNVGLGTRITCASGSSTTTPANGVVLAQGLTGYIVTNILRINWIDISIVQSSSGARKSPRTAHSASAGALPSLSAKRANPSRLPKFGERDGWIKL